MGYNPQESLENTINTIGTLLGVRPIVPWRLPLNLYHYYSSSKNQVNGRKINFEEN